MKRRTAREKRFDLWWFSVFGMGLVIGLVLLFLFPKPWQDIGGITGLTSFMFILAAAVDRHDYRVQITLLRDPPPPQRPERRPYPGYDFWGWLGETSCLRSINNARRSNNVPNKATSLPADLAGLKTLAELEAMVGEITDEERELIRKAHQAGEPTEEELAAFVPGFEERIIQRVREKLALDKNT